MGTGSDENVYLDLFTVGIQNLGIKILKSKPYSRVLLIFSCFMTILPLPNLTPWPNKPRTDPSHGIFTQSPDLFLINLNPQAWSLH